MRAYYMFNHRFLMAIMLIVMTISIIQLVAFNINIIQVIIALTYLRGVLVLLLSMASIRPNTLINKIELIIIFISLFSFIYLISIYGSGIIWQKITVSFNIRRFIPLRGIRYWAFISIIMCLFYLLFILYFRVELISNKKSPLRGI